MLTPTRALYALPMLRHAKLTMLAAKCVVVEGDRMLEKAEAIAGPEFPSMQFDIGIDYFENVYFLGCQVAHAVKPTRFEPSGESNGVRLSPKPEADGGVKQEEIEEVDAQQKALKLRALRQKYAKKAVMLARIIKRSVRSMHQIDAKLRRARAAPFRGDDCLNFDDVIAQMQVFIKEALPVAEATIPPKLSSEDEE